MSDPDAADHAEPAAGKKKVPGLLPGYGVPDEIAGAAAEALAQLFRRGTLSARDRRLITISVLAAMGSQDPLRLHVAMGLAADLSREEIYELILHVGYYAGFGRSTDAFKVTQDVLAERPENA